jgi:nitrilase
LSQTDRSFTVAIAQATPVFLDAHATVEKACGLIAQAAHAGAKVVLFPEAFVPGYPDWVWVVPNSKKAVIDALFTELLANAVTINDDHCARLCSAARSAGIHVAIGVNERNAEASGASLYNTLLYIDDTGEIMGKHRKLMPTGGERLMWAQGDGSTLEGFNTPFARIGGLICWENFMPLARHAMYAQGTQLHLAPTWDSSERWLESLKFVAREGGMFVLNSCMALRMDDIPDRFEFKSLYPQGREWINKGNSCVIDPKGDVIAGPVSEKEELILAQIDLGAISAAKWMFDAAGHYARPDVFKFTVDRTPNPLVADAESPED